jgi:maleylpyruvate isomerase
MAEASVPTALARWGLSPAETETRRGSVIDERPTPRLDWLRSATAMFDRALVGCLDAIESPSHLPGWTRAHVATHIARNADAMRNLVRWASTGIESPMYPDPERRTLDVVEGATRPAPVILSDVRSAAGRLDADASALDAEAWGATVRMRSGRAVGAHEIPYLRARELWIHATDLDSTIGFEDLPEDAVAALLEDVLGSFALREDCPPTELVAVDLDRTWHVGPSGIEPRTVRSTAVEVLSYSTGRPTPGIDVPPLPPWL